MNKIFKYFLDLSELQEIKLPIKAEILAIQDQSDSHKISQIQLPLLCLWAIVDPEETKTEKRIIRIFGTGHEIPERRSDLKYIDTVQQFQGHIVWHVFEVIKK